MDTRGLLDAREAAALLGISRQTLYSYVSRGLIKVYPGKSYRENYYRRADIERLLASKQVGRKAGQIASHTLDWGKPVLSSGISLISEQMLYYRGMAVSELIKQPFEHCIAQLWQCEPALFQQPAPLLDAAWQQLAARHDGSLWHSMALLALARQQLADLPQQNSSSQALTLLRLMCACLLGITPSSASLGRQLARHWQLPDAQQGLLDRALILCADHELNASSFVARCTGSTGSEMAAALLAALATLGGDKHGGATWQVEKLLDEHLPGNTLPDAAAGSPPAGFGHPLYPEGDPRACLLMSNMPDSPAIRFAQNMHDRYQLMPSIDFALVALRRSLGLPRGAAFTLFALGRTAGWLAHIMEQADRGSLIRPRAHYDGPPAAKHGAAANSGENSA